EQKSKSELLNKLKADRRHTVKELKGIRKIAKKYNFSEQLDTSFFEFKGSLLFPVTGRVVKYFGLFEDEEFHYRLAHKGLLFQVSPKTKVRSIHEGKVAFAAEISGHGRTL